jgi:hypothetical protein
MKTTNYTERLQGNAGKKLMNLLIMFLFAAGASAANSPTALGLARISSVTGVNGACSLSTTNGGGIQFWEVAQNHTYTVTLSDLTDAANGGTDPTIQVIVKSSSNGNTCVTATWQSAGVYSFNITLPITACNTMPVLYGTLNCSPGTGKWARQNNASNPLHLAHLRAAYFDGNCSVTGSDSSCDVVQLLCPPSDTVYNAQTQAYVDSLFAEWLSLASASGCTGTIANDNIGAPSICGGSTLVTFTFTSITCDTILECSSVFTVDSVPPVVLQCATSDTIVEACQSQSAVDSEFEAWLQTASIISGGLNPVLTNNGNSIGAPNACGGSSTVTFTVTSDCEDPLQCTATFIVAAPVVPTCTLSSPQVDPECFTTDNSLCANTSAGVSSYAWIILDGSGWIITDGQGTSCITYTAGTGSATIRLIITGCNGCVSDSCEITIYAFCPYWGCTLGFWKNHPQIWNNTTDPISQCLEAAIAVQGSPYSGNGTISSSFMNTFGLTVSEMNAAGYNPSLTLLQALHLGGGGFRMLARQGVAALLNTCGLSGNYYYNTSQVLTGMHDAIVSMNPSPAGIDFANHNEQQPDLCPPGGPATHPSLRHGIIVNDEAIISAYPNPFNSKATIDMEFYNSIPEVTVEVFSLNGQKVATLYNNHVDAGKDYQLELNGDKLSPGMYIYKINTGENIYYQKLTLIK